jgi:hypothetical protein
MRLKYYSVRVLAGLLFMGSFAGGFLAAEYGKWIGWLTFIVLAASGVLLHRVAGKIDKCGD